jgi:prevent-host-death family protein
MREVSITDVRRTFGKVLRRAERGDRTLVYRYGKPAAVFVPIRDLELIEQLASGVGKRKQKAQQHLSI